MLAFIVYFGWTSWFDQLFLPEKEDYDNLPVNWYLEYHLGMVES